MATAKEVKHAPFASSAAAAALHVFISKVRNRCKQTLAKLFAGEGNERNTVFLFRDQVEHFYKNKLVDLQLTSPLMSLQLN